MARNVWGFWDCNYCGNKHIRGDNDCCPDCGHRRSADVKFYLDKDNLVEVSADKKNDEANWICSFCGNQNNNKDQQCVSCGASKDEASGSYFSRNTDVSRTISSPSSSRSEPTTSHLREITSQSNTRAVRSSFPFRRLAMVALPILVLIITIVGIARLVSWYNEPIEKQITIDRVSWTRSIDIEELRTYNESGWSLPHDAQLSYTRTEIRSYNKVLDHYETKTRRVSSQSIVGYHEDVVGYDDLGNGQFKEITRRVPDYTTVYSTETYQDPVYRKDPVYDTKYYYEIDRWEKSRSVETSGNDKSPYFGEVTLRNKERQSASHENYYIIGMVDDKEQTYNLDYSDWQKCNVGDTLQLTVRRGDNKVLSVDGITCSTF